MFRPSEVAAGHFDKGVLDAFWIAGDEPHSQIGATPFQLPDECLNRLSLKLPSGWKIDPNRIISYQQITPSEISPYTWQLYLTNCSDPIFLTPLDEEVLKLFLSPDWMTFDQELGFKLSELIALEFREETTLYARPFLKHGPLLLLPLTPEKKTRLLELVQTSEWTAVSPSLYVQLQACVAFRQAYAGDSGTRDWLLYGGRQHYLEVGADPKTISRLQKQVNALKWRSTSNSGWFDANQQTAFVYEPARVEQFDPRLGIYFKGGHEVNVYDKTDVADLRASA
jgi:hypothetical protein